MTGVALGKPAKQILLLGATGTIGRATARALVRRGYAVTCLLRQGSDVSVLPGGVTTRCCDFADQFSLAADGFQGNSFDVVISCLASRTGTASDAWAVDHDAHQAVLALAKASGVKQFILLSAICVQKPKLAFQHAKRAFETALIGSGLTYSIVRPTAYFKSLSGQLARVQKGKPFLVFGDGRLTACKPISDGDLARYLVDCIEDASRHNRILPIGGPGPAITPLQQAEFLFQLLPTAPKVRHVPVALLHVIVAVLKVGGVFSKRLAEKAELARIGRYYATESMLVWDAVAQRYDAAATPETGTDTLPQHYAALIAGRETTERREHAVF